MTNELKIILCICGGLFVVLLSLWGCTTLLMKLHEGWLLSGFVFAVFLAMSCWIALQRQARKERDERKAAHEATMRQIEADYRAGLKEIRGGKP